MILQPVRVCFYSGLQKIICRHMRLNFNISCSELIINYPTIMCYRIQDGVNLKSESGVKLLGVHVNQSLS